MIKLQLIIDYHAQEGFISNGTATTGERLTLRQLPSTMKPSCVIMDYTSLCSWH